MKKQVKLELNLKAIYSNEKLEIIIIITKKQ